MILALVATYGGRLLGLECANALQNLGLETYRVNLPGLMGVQLDAGGSGTLRRKIEALGVQVQEYARLLRLLKRTTTVQRDWL